MRSQTNEFEAFLLQRLGEDYACHSTSDWAGTGNTIGAIALRLGILDLDQIDRILDQQEDDRRLFGEIAVALEFVTQDQVDRLISLQRYHQLLEVAEFLVIRGQVDVVEMQTHLLDYLREFPIQISPPEVSEPAAS